MLTSTHPGKIAGPLRKPGSTVVRHVVRAQVNREELVQRVQQVSQTIEEAGVEVQRQLSNHERNATREEALWKRQEAFWAREAQRWEAERASWDAREERLLEKLAQLQSVLVDLVHARSARSWHDPASDQSTATSSLSSSSSPQAQPQKAQAPTASVRGVGSPEPSPASRGRVPTSSVLEEASRFLPEDDAPFSPPAADDYPALDVMVDDASVERVRSSLHNAFSAVHSADVLSPAYDASLASQAAAAASPVLDIHSSERSEASTTTIPTLRSGADDIFWMSELHKGLLQANLFPDEEEMEDWVFGPQTESAVMTFQASVGLPETGVVDEATWSALLGPEYRNLRPPPEPQGAPSAEEASLGTSLLEGFEAPSQPEPVSPEAARVRELRQKSEMENRKRTGYVDRRPDTASASELVSWPALREGDGGKDVHYLQVALENKGFIADEEDQRWWFFGSSTNDCVMTFQACSGLPETGTVERDTWLALLTPDATPASLSGLSNAFEDDMTDDSEAVWLLGEQRWARRRK